MSTTAHPFPLAAQLRSEGRAETVVREKEFKKNHLVFDGAPDDWAKERGATHTLYIETTLREETRPARLLKTRLYVGVDETPDGGIEWERWHVTCI